MQIPDGSVHVLGDGYYGVVFWLWIQRRELEVRYQCLQLFLEDEFLV